MEPAFSKDCQPHVGAGVELILPGKSATRCSISGERWQQYYFQCLLAGPSTVAVRSFTLQVHAQIALARSSQSTEAETRHSMTKQNYRKMSEMSCWAKLSSIWLKAALLLPLRCNSVGFEARPDGNGDARPADNDGAEDGDNVINSIDSISAYAISEVCGLATFK